MKITVTALLVLALGFSCKAQDAISENLQKEFEAVALTFQARYIEGSVNCEEILHAVDPNVKMAEITFSQPSKSFTYTQLEQFCPHLPKKQVLETTTEQKLLTATLGYDYVSQLYLRKSKSDTVRETTSRIWENKNGVWKIIHMNSLLNKACD